MAGSRAEIAGRRVRLALGGLTPQTRSTLETAIRIALERGEEIDCVFVEEVALFHAAALPITRELAEATGEARALDVSRIERSLRRQAADVRRMLEQAAAHARLRWNFEIVRGALLRAALERAGEGDVIVVGITGNANQGALLELHRDALAALAGEPDWRLRRRGGTLVARPSEQRTATGS